MFWENTQDLIQHHRLDKSFVSLRPIKVSENIPRLQVWTMPWKRFKRHFIFISGIFIHEIPLAMNHFNLYLLIRIFVIWCDCNSHCIDCVPECAWFSCPGIIQSIAKTNDSISQCFNWKSSQNQAFNDTQS